MGGLLLIIVIPTLPIYYHRLYMIHVPVVDAHGVAVKLEVTKWLSLVAIISKIYLYYYLLAYLDYGFNYA